MGVKIIGTGSYLPSKVLTNFDLEKMVDTNDEWIRTRTGITERRIAHQKEAASDLGIKASLKAMEAANISPHEIDIIIVATATPDMVFPSTACFIQKGIKATSSICFDITAACAGFIYALTVGEQFLKNGSFKTALIVGTEIFSRITDWTDRNTCVLFGDGAGACILKNDSEEGGILATDLGADSSASDYLMVPILDNKLHYIKMKGNDIFRYAVSNLVSSSKNLLKKVHLKSEEINLVIPHQANIRIIEAISKRLHIPMEKMFINLDKYGNTSAASVPIALDEAVRNDRIEKGDYILFMGFGGGLVWGSCVVKW